MLSSKNLEKSWGTNGSPGIRLPGPSAHYMGMHFGLKARKLTNKALKTRHFLEEMRSRRLEVRLRPGSPGDDNSLVSGRFGQTSADVFAGIRNAYSMTPRFLVLPKIVSSR